MNQKLGPKRGPHWVPRRENAHGSKGSLYPKVESDFGSLVAEVLWSRGHLDANDFESSKSFLEPRLGSLQSPFSIWNLEKSADRIADGVINDECICVYGDYDMDGMSGLSLLVKFFQEIGCSRILHYQPHRFNEGYGVHADAVEVLHSKGAKILITVDTGSMAFEAADKAADLGLVYVVTDHHQCDPVKTPATPYFVNPNQAGDPSKLKNLSGAGVAFYLAMGVRAKLREKGFFANRSEPNLMELLEYYVLGSIGDVVNLDGDNRVLVRLGLERLRLSQRPGIRTLIKGLREGNAKIGARDVAFTIVPKLNSASRMGQVEIATELLMSEDANRARELFDQIMALNEERSQKQKDALIEARALAQGRVDAGDRVLLIAGPWHEGILGIIAAKIAEDFSMPAIIVSEAHGTNGEPLFRGSMRTPAPHHSLRLLDFAKDHLLRYGGHQAAAGLAFIPENFDLIRSALQIAMEKLSESEDLPTLAYDGKLTRFPKFHEFKALEFLEPLGPGNPEPLFLIESFPVTQFEPLKDLHIKARKSGMEFIGFGFWQRLQEIAAQSETVDLLVVPEVSTFRFQEKAQFRIQALRAPLVSEELAMTAEI